MFIDLSHLVSPHQTWMCSPTRSKANVLTPGCGEGECSVYCRARQGERAAHAENPHPPTAFREGALKAVCVRERVAGCVISSYAVLGLVGNKVKFRASPVFQFQPAWGLHSLMVSSFHPWGSASSKNSLGTCVRPLSVSSRERGVCWPCSVAGVQSELLPGSWPRALLCFYVFTFPGHSLWSQPPETQERAERLKQKAFTSKDIDTGACTWFQSPLSFGAPHSQGNRFRTRNGIKFPLERLITNCRQRRSVLGGLGFTSGPGCELLVVLTHLLKNGEADFIQDHHSGFRGHCSGVLQSARETQCPILNTARKSENLQPRSRWGSVDGHFLRRKHQG